jgi:ribonuclease D
VPEHPLVPSEDPELLASTEDLAGLLEHVRAAGCFAYDTEFIGELSYHPKLCLVQIATAQRIALVDPLQEVDLTGLWEAIADPEIRTIVHAGFQDLEPVVRALGRPPANVVDTQLAAAFVGQPYPASLHRLTEELLDVRLGKALTFTQWDHRPLSARHRRYAADDVRYLPALDAEITRRLEALGHAGWCAQECRQLNEVSPYRFDPEAQFWRVRGAERLDGRGLGALRALFILRDEMAREHDVPPRTLLKDELLVALSRTPPRSLIDAGRRGPHPQRLEQPRTEEGAGERTRVDSLFAILSGYCRARGVDPALVMSRGEIAQLHRRAERGQGPGELRMLSAWRGELLGEVLPRFVRGEIELCFSWGEEGIACRPGPSP